MTLRWPTLRAGLLAAVAELRRRYLLGHGTILGVYFVLLAVAAAIVAGMVVTSSGRGGQMAAFRRDVPPVDLDLRTPTDVAMVRLPIALLGYQEQATGEVLAEVARMLADRDAEIAELRAEVSRLAQAGSGDSEAAAAPGRT